MSAPAPRQSPLRLISRSRAAWRRIGPFLGVTRWQVGALAVASMLAGLAEASLLAVIAAIATAVSVGGSTVETSLGPLTVDSSLPWVFAVGAVLALVRAGLQTLNAYLPSKMSATAMATLRQRLFDGFVGTSWPIQASQRNGLFHALMLGHVTSASGAVIIFAQGLSAFFMFTTMLVAAVVLDWPTAILIGTLSVSLFLVLRPLSRRTRRHAAQFAGESVEYSKGMEEVVQLAEERQVFGASPDYRHKVHTLIERVRRPLHHMRFISNLVPVVYQSIAFGILLVALAVVAQVELTSLASLTAVVLILLRSLTYGQQLQYSLTKGYELTPFMDTLRDAIDEYRAHPAQDGDQPMPAIRTIGMRGVGFSYAAGETTLSDFDFDVSAGEAVGIVGPSGAGKSTLVQLLLRLRQPDEGLLYVNGQDTRLIRRADWQRNVAYVPQSPQIFWGTVAENIAFDRADLTVVDIERAAKLAHVHDDILSWPRGYDTMIGDRASAVSGGQRQRLCLARALAARPSVLILDEPTSALDVHSEQLIQQSLESLKGEMTLFMVAHRLSTLAVCDRVMVVANGRLEAFDVPSRLRETNAFFRRAVDITRQQTGV